MAAPADKAMEHGIELLDSAFVTLGLMPPKEGGGGNRAHGAHETTRYTGSSTSYDLNVASNDTMSLGVPKLIQFDSLPRDPLPKKKEDELSDLTLENGRKPNRPKPKRSLSLGNLLPFGWNGGGETTPQEQSQPNGDERSVEEVGDDGSLIQKFSDKIRGNNNKSQKTNSPAERSLVQRIKSMKKLRKRNPPSVARRRPSPEPDELQHTIRILNKNYDEAIRNSPRNSPRKNGNGNKQGGGWFRRAFSADDEKDNEGASPPERVPTTTSTPSTEGTSRASNGSQGRRSPRKARRLSFTQKEAEQDQSFHAPLIIVGEAWENPP